MIVYRLQKSKHGDDISGFGSTQSDGRWNFRGSLPILYTASSRSLAILETLAHLPKTNAHVPKYSLLHIYVPDQLVQKISDSDLPVGWREKNYQFNVQEWGMKWLESRSSVAIIVPSYISLDDNILINPSHSEFKNVRVERIIENFIFDERLL